MQIEDIARVGFSSRRPSQQQRKRTVGNRMLAEIVVDDQNVFTPVHPIFADAAAGIRSDVLQGGKLAGSGYQDRGIFHGLMLIQLFDDLGNGGVLLSDGNVDAFHVATFLIDDRIDGDCRLSGLSVTNDQFSLTLADRDHGVDDF